ncbi:MAG: hypothetical protein UD936_09325 [Acutalibacteraceae bacterium]|nr:hypothetical protein [Acutalibacteraceae bacterium]
MKIDFEKVCYDEAGRFMLFKSNPEKFYLIRVLDFEGGLRFADTIENTEEIVKGSCTAFEYLLTKNEFELYETDREMFLSLVDTLCANAPIDRVLKVFTQASPESKPVTLQAKPGNPTGTDENLIEGLRNDMKEQAREKSEDFRRFLSGEKDTEMFFVHSGHLNKIYPAIDFEGKMFFVEGEDNVKGLVEATKIFDNQYYQVDSEQARTIIENCKKYGVFKIVYVKPDGSAYILDRDDLLDQPTEDKWSVYNSPIYNAFIRCIECAGIENPQVKATQMTLTSQLSHLIFKTTFLLPLQKPSEEQPEAVVLSRAAEALYNEKKFEFYGAENYSYVPLEGNEFPAITLQNSDTQTKALPLFTDLEEFNLIFKGKVVPIAVTLDEAFSMLNDVCSIIIFNPATLGFLFAADAMKQMKEFSEKPLTMFKAKEEAPQEQKPTNIEIPPMPRQASTEDILHMVANQINRSEAVKKEQAVIPKTEEDDEDKSENEAVEEEEVKAEEVAEADTEETAEETPEEADEDTKPVKAEEVPAEKKGGFFSIFKKKK